MYPNCQSGLAIIYDIWTLFLGSTAIFNLLNWNTASKFEKFLECWTFGRQSKREEWCLMYDYVCKIPFHDNCIDLLSLGFKLNIFKILQILKKYELLCEIIRETWSSLHNFFGGKNMFSVNFKTNLRQPHFINHTRP